MPQQINIFDELIIDNFAGGGGASTGIELATGRPVDIAINHDPSAIAMHVANHPFTRHFCESVWEVDPRKVTHGQPVGLAWFSPDCTHHSKARGGKPVKKEIRGLAWVAVRWAATVRPRVICLENVEEFQSWGPLDKEGKPIKERAGETFRSFVKALKSHGYKVDWRELRACDYGAPTIRKRFFLIARNDGQPIVWPEPTHAAPDSEAVKAGRLKPWRSAAEIIDWTLPCPSIFDSADEIYRKYGVRAVRPLADATMRRIARGLKKFVIDSAEPFIVPWTVSNITNATGARVDSPLNTIRTGGGGGQMLLTPTLIQYHGEQSEREVRGQRIDSPLLTADAANRYGLVSAFLTQSYGGGYTSHGNRPDRPLNTVTAQDHNAVCAAFVSKFYGCGTGQDATDPLHTITLSPGHFGEVRAFLVKHYGTGDGQPLTEPLHTVTTKDRFELITIHGEQYAIADIGLRMLTPRELFNAQGFPPDYIIDIGPNGETITKAAQVARCGNAVPPPFAEALVRANLPEMCGARIETMAALRDEMAG